MSAFLPALGRNVIKVDTERLKDAFSDVRDGEEACIVQLELEEVRTSLYPCQIPPMPDAGCHFFCSPSSSLGPVQSTHSSPPCLSSVPFFHRQHHLHHLGMPSTHLYPTPFPSLRRRTDRLLPRPTFLFSDSTLKTFQIAHALS